MIQDDVKQDIRHYWVFRDKHFMTDEVSMIGKQVITSVQLQQQALDQLHTTT